MKRHGLALGLGLFSILALAAQFRPLFARGAELGMSPMEVLSASSPVSSSVFLMFATITIVAIVASLWYGISGLWRTRHVSGTNRTGAWGKLKYRVMIGFGIVLTLLWLMAAHLGFVYDNPMFWLLSNLPLLVGGSFLTFWGFRGLRRLKGVGGSGSQGDPFPTGKAPVG